MKTIPVLTHLIPMLNAVKRSSVYNAVVADQAPVLARKLQEAANDDLFIVTPLLGALQRLAEAADFEPQQVAMAETLHLADGLLGSISDGSVARADRKLRTSAELVESLTRDAAAIVDVYSPHAGVLRRMRSDAAELGVLVDAEIREGTRPSSHAELATLILDGTDRLRSGDFAVREQQTTAINRYVREIAA